MSLLQPGEVEPVHSERLGAASPFVVVADHAGRLVPRSLGDLGLPADAFARHIAYDIGILETARDLAAALDAPFVAQRYSRLVIDCNRLPDAPTAIPERSETTDIPANRNVTADQRRARVDALHTPYHERIATLLERRAASGLETILIAMHSFTPVFHEVPRPWHLGLLYDRDRRLAARMLECCAKEPGLVVGDREPYPVNPDEDYTIPIHAQARGLLHLGLEIRQDLIAGPEGQRTWSRRLERLLPRLIA